MSDQTDPVNVHSQGTPDRYARVLSQFEAEAERYVRENTLIDVERYSMGKHMVRLLLSGLAMHAMNHFFGGSGGQAQAPQQQSVPASPKAKTSTGSATGGDFEKLHPREQVQGGKHKPGQFAEKPGKGNGMAKPSLADAVAKGQETLSKRGTPEEERAKFEANLPPAVPQPQLDPQTAKVAEVWHGDKQGAKAFADEHAPSESNTPHMDKHISDYLKRIGQTESNKYTDEYKQILMDNAEKDASSGEHGVFSSGPDDEYANGKIAAIKEHLTSKGYDTSDTQYNQNAGTSRFRVTKRSQSSSPATDEPSQRNYPTHNAALSSGNIDLSQPRAKQPSGKTNTETESESGAKWWHDPEFIAEQTQAQAQAPQTESTEATQPQQQGQRKQQSFKGGTKAWNAGMNQGTVGMQSQEHSDMHEIGSHLRKSMSNAGNISASERQRKAARINSMVSDYAYANGVDEDTVRQHASETYRSNKEQAKGFQDGEHRDLTYKPMNAGGAEAPPEDDDLRYTDERADKLPTVTMKDDPPVAKPFLAPPGSPIPEKTAYDTDPRRGTPEQKAARDAQRKARDQGQPTPQEALGQAFDKAMDTSQQNEPAAAPPAPQPAIADVMRNPAAEARKAKAEAAKRQAEIDKRTAFNPEEFGDGIDEPQHAGRTVNKESFTKRDAAGNIVEQDLVAYDKARKARESKVRKINRDTKKDQADNPDKHVLSAIGDYGLHHDDFHRHIGEMEKHEQGQWKAREGMKSAIKKAWKMNATDANELEDSGKDTSHIQNEDQLSGEIPESDLYEHLGSDPHYWAEKAHAMIKEPIQPKPGRHDQEWVDRHAQSFSEQQSSQQQPQEEYPEPEDGMPFSRKSLIRDIDRYFNDARRQFSQSRRMADARIFTVLDDWL